MKSKHDVTRIKIGLVNILLKQKINIKRVQLESFKNHI